MRHSIVAASAALYLVRDRVRVRVRARARVRANHPRVRANPNRFSGAVLDADEETRDEGAAEVDEVAHLLRVKGER